MVKKIPLLKKGKHKKHDAIVNDFEAQKNKHCMFFFLFFQTKKKKLRTNHIK